MERPTRDVLELRLPCDRRAPSIARHALDRAFGFLGAPALGDSELVASELVTNAVLHGRGPIVLRADVSAERLRIEVDDDMPTMGPRHDGSRGLDLIARVAPCWGVRPHGDGKTVWAEIPYTHD